MASPTSVVAGAEALRYDDLRLRVKEQGQHAVVLARVDRLAKERIELAEAEAARSRVEAEAARLEIDRLSAELATALQRAQAKRKTSTAVAAQARDEIGAECEERVREERARGEQEAAMLRAAAANDLATARAHHAAEMAAVAAERQGDTLAWQAHEAQRTDAQRRRATKHAERLRAVIASEEACQRQCEVLLSKLRSLAQAAIPLAARKRRAELETRTWLTGTQAAVAELAPLEAALEASEAARRTAAEAGAAQLSNLVREVGEMRAHCKQAMLDDAARRGEQCKAQLGAQQDRSRRELARQRERLESAAARREGEAREEAAELRAQLASAHAALRETEAAMRSGGDALLRELD